MLNVASTTYTKMKIFPLPLTKYPLDKALKEIKLFLAIGYSILALTVFVSIFFALPAMVVCGRPLVLCFNPAVKKHPDGKKYMTASVVLAVLSVLCFVVYLIVK